MNAIQCHRARMSFELYLDGGLSLEECEGLEAHLFECAACAAAVGDDVRLGEAIEESLRSGTVEHRPERPARAWARPARVAAAAVVLLAAGIGIGHLTASKPRGGPSAPAAGTGDEIVKGQPEGTAELPPSEVTDDPWVGLATFTDADLIDAERNALKSRGERFEWRVRRAEAAFDLMRPLLEETATPARVVNRLSERVRQAVANPGRTEGERIREAVRHVLGAELLLRRDPHAAFGPVSEWLASAQSPIERRAAVRLLGLLRVREAHDLLAAEVKPGPTRESALDGLVLLRDPRSRDVFASVLDDHDPQVEAPTRVKAAGGLHRLGDPRGLEFLVGTFKKTPAARGPNDDLRRRIVSYVVANLTPEATAELPDLIGGVRLDPKERGLLIEVLTLSGMPDTDPVIMQLRKPGPPDRDHGRPDRGGPPPSERL
jgi:hypothetical protein